MVAFTPADIGKLPVAVYERMDDIPVDHRGILLLWVLTVDDVFDVLEWRVIPGKETLLDDGKPVLVQTSVMAVLLETVYLGLKAFEEVSSARMMRTGRLVEGTHMELSNTEDTDVVGWVSMAKGTFDHLGVAVAPTASVVTFTRPVSIRDPRSKVKHDFHSGDEVEMHPSGSAIRTLEWGNGKTMDTGHLSWIHLDPARITDYIEDGTLVPK